MSCCAPAIEAAAELGRSPSPDELRIASRELGNGLRQIDLSVPSIHCGACIAAIERGFRGVAGVERARVNLSTKRLAVTWRGETPPPVFAVLDRLGYQANLFEPESDARDPELSRLLRALAVAGFCAMNIMLLSVSVWSGADAETRQAFHWISAALALPALVYSGRIFYASAWSALRHGRTNMDVPISIGVTLAFALSLYDTIGNGPHAYFDASTSLLFFLLIGRTLDHMMRGKARAAVEGLSRMMPRGATVLRDDGSRDYLPADEIRPGMRLVLMPGERILVDGVVESGSADIDCAIATGESAPQAVDIGSTLRSGTLNLNGFLMMTATADARGSFVAEMIAMMDAAEGGRARYRRLADRAARLYSPVVHATALLTFLGWLAATGDWHRAISIAIAVLIITCPCALGLAVPMVQAVAARRLFEAGIMVKDGSAMERLAEIDWAVFDKTGTLTVGRPRVVEIVGDEKTREIAAALARHSNHPVARAVAAIGKDADLSFRNVREVAGLGIEATLDGHLYRLGRSSWASGEQGPQTVLACDGRPVLSIAVEDGLRPDAREAVEALRDAGIGATILSGDSPAAVTAAARRVGISDAVAGLLPSGKIDRLAALSASGRKVLMVGDGLNDAPALSAAHVSMAPASAADIGRNAADFVFLHDTLMAIPRAYAVCKEAGRLVRQNFALAIAYNAIALPVAILGHVTPLIAALAMSLSSVLVVANALRLRGASPSGKVRRPVRSVAPELAVEA